jgi:tetratricopeptide (TPR) repeat protein
MSDPSPQNPRLQPSAGYFDVALGEDEEADLVPQDEPGMVIGGRYVLKSILGEGGTGHVWRAEQTQPVQREVAVKIIGAGLVTGPVVTRFNREYQVLARLEHPNIAAIFDAGELADGRPYFVMEIVSGQPITQWCAERQIPVKGRVEIFLQACLAVQHAHHKGILHRDLKPSNVMVTEVNGKPVVKVIDFGIAKALAGDLDAGPDVTVRGMVLGTPRYMSPEQAGLTGQDVDTRSDVYALGVLLYELLTGSTPVTEGEEKHSSLSDLLQRVRHTETELPSRRLLRLAPQAQRLARELCSELDWILLRALQKDREQRYPTAIALAEELQRHLRQEPVLAGPPSTAYRVKKWIVRHRHAALSTAAVFGALSAGVATTWWALDLAEMQRQEAARQKASAMNEAHLALQVSSQLSDLLGGARKHVEAGMNTQILRNLADEVAAGMPRFATLPKTAAPLAKQLAELYTTLQEPARALPWYRRHWELLKETDGPQAKTTLDALYTLGWRSISCNQNAAAAVFLEQAMQGYQTHPEPAHRWMANYARKELARALSRLGRHEEALKAMTLALQQQSQKKPAQVATWLQEYADILRAANKDEEAATALHRALALLPEDEAHASQRTNTLHALATTSHLREHYDEALAASAERVTIVERTQGSSHPQLIHALISHATLACKCPGCPGGEAAARRALALAQAAGHESLLADAWITLSETLRMSERYAESEQAVRDGIAAVNRTHAERWRVLELHRRLGDLLTSRSEFKEALKEYQTAAAGWFSAPAVGRAREKEELIFGSYIKFWERAAKAASPLADAQQLEEWRRKYAAWKTERTPPATITGLP